MGKNVTADERTRVESPTSRLIDWFAVGQGCEIKVDGVVISLRVVGRKGRRARLSVVAPAGATFTTSDGKPSADLQ